MTRSALLGLVLALVACGGGAPAPGPEPTPVAEAAPAPEPKAAAAPGKSFKIVKLHCKVIERRSAWWKFSWLLEIENRTDYLLALRGVIDFLDGDGFMIDNSEAKEIDLLPQETATFKGYELIGAEAADTVRKYEARVTRR